VFLGQLRGGGKRATSRASFLPPGGNRQSKTCKGKPASNTGGRIRGHHRRRVSSKEGTLQTTNFTTEGAEHHEEKNNNNVGKFRLRSPSGVASWLSARSRKKSIASRLGVGGERLRLAEKGKGGYTMNAVGKRGTTRGRKSGEAPHRLRKQRWQKRRGLNRQRLLAKDT